MTGFTEIMSEDGKVVPSCCSEAASYYSPEAKYAEPDTSHLVSATLMAFCIFMEKVNPTVSINPFALMAFNDWLRRGGDPNDPDIGKYGPWARQISEIPASRIAGGRPEPTTAAEGDGMLFALLDNNGTGKIADGAGRVRRPKKAER